MRRLVAVLAAALLLGSCGGEDVREARERAEADLRARVDDLRDRARQAGDEFTRTVRQVLEDIRKAVPDASLPTPQVEQPSATRTCAAAR